MTLSCGANKSFQASSTLMDAISKMLGAQQTWQTLLLPRKYRKEAPVIKAVIKSKHLVSKHNKWSVLAPLISQLSLNRATTGWIGRSSNFKVTSPSKHQPLSSVTIQPTLMIQQQQQWAVLTSKLWVQTTHLLLVYPPWCWWVMLLPKGLKNIQAHITSSHHCTKNCPQGQNSRIFPLSLNKTQLQCHEHRKSPDQPRKLNKSRISGLRKSSQHLKIKLRILYPHMDVFQHEEKLRQNSNEENRSWVSMTETVSTFNPL